MPILTLLPLIFGVLKAIAEIVAWLEKHPEVRAEIRGVLGDISNHLEAAQAVGQTITPSYPPEAP